MDKNLTILSLLLLVRFLLGVTTVEVLTVKINNGVPNRENYK
jgi:hypothetical protein